MKLTIIFWRLCLWYLLLHNLISFCLETQLQRDDAMELYLFRKEKEDIFTGLQATDFLLELVLQDLIFRLSGLIFMIIMKYSSCNRCNREFVSEHLTIWNPCLFIVFDLLICAVINFPSQVPDEMLYVVQWSLSVNGFFLVAEVIFLANYCILFSVKYFIIWWKHINNNIEFTRKLFL